MADELSPLLAVHLPGAATSRVGSYPSPRDVGVAMGTGVQNLCFLDVVSDPEQALQLLGEMARMGPSIQVIALLAGNDSDAMLKCLRGGAADFLIQPFTGEQIEGVLAKLAPYRAVRMGAGNRPRFSSSCRPRELAAQRPSPAIWRSSGNGTERNGFCWPTSIR